MRPATLGTYTLLEPLGSGGMGDVYRARETRLDRLVALKLLPEGPEADREQLWRFQREARAASALNHPHIVSVFDAGEIDGHAYIAMEIVEGLPLLEWAKRHRPPVARILDVFTQVADALGAAHEIGVVHRDVKGTNILVTAQGYAKVLDFGLAKTAAMASTSDTATQLATQAGVVLGTVQYMSPEQALGLEVDARTDVFSLGILLFEALSGVHPFARTTQLDVMHAIVHDPPAPPPGASAEVQWVLGKALAKERDERYQTMREFGADLRRLRRRVDQPGETTRGAAEARRPRNRVARLAVVGVLIGAAAGAGFLIARRAGGPQGVPRMERLTALTSDAGFEGEPTFSPDGALIAYVSDRTGNFDVYLKRVDGGPDLQLTTDRADDVQPAFSPDGRQIAFVSGRAYPGGLVYPAPAAPLVGGDIWIMPALGGDARRVASGNDPSWLPDGSALVFVTGRWFDDRLMRVSAAGGEAEPIPLKPLRGNEFNQVRRPAVSPDGRFIAFGSDAQVFVVGIAGGTPERIAAGRDAAWSADSRSVLFTSADRAYEGSLGAVRLDAAGHATGAPEYLTAGPQRVTDAVMSKDGRFVAFAAETITANIESLAFDAERGSADPGATPRALTAGNDVIFFFSPSPDLRTLTYGAGGRIWKIEPGRPAVPLTDHGTEGGDGHPRWSPDGSLIAFARGSSALRGLSAAHLFVMNPDGSNPRPVARNASLNGFFEWAPDGRSLIVPSPEDRQFYRIDLATGRSRTLTNDRGLLGIGVESRDGAWLVVQRTNEKTGDLDLCAVRLDGASPLLTVVQTPGEDAHPMLSPSGRWLFWILDHHNIHRVPGPAQGWRRAAPEKVTNFQESGLYIDDPQLSQDGRQLFYTRRERTADLWLMELRQDAR